MNLINIFIVLTPMIIIFYLVYVLMKAFTMISLEDKKFIESWEKQYQFALKLNHMIKFDGNNCNRQMYIDGKELPFRCMFEEIEQRFPCSTSMKCHSFYGREGE